MAGGDGCDFIPERATQLAARELRNSMARLVSKRRRGIQTYDLFEFGLGASWIIELLVGET